MISPWLGPAIVFSALILVVVSIFVYLLVRRHLAHSAGNYTPQSTAVPAVASNYDAEAVSIRLTRARMWSARNGHNGITLDELDLVAPVSAYKPRRTVGSSSSSAGGDADVDADADADVEPKPAVGGAVTYGDVTDHTCAVCLDDMEAGDKTRGLRCGHEFHGGCIETWLTKQNRCPVCNVEPLEPSALAKRRNARSTARRGIDAALSSQQQQQRRWRTRGQNGVWQLADETEADDEVIPVGGVVAPTSIVDEELERWPAAPPSPGISAGPS
jgi:Ring finger domain